jgi:hypothetical protein
MGERAWRAGKIGCGGGCVILGLDAARFGPCAIERATMTKPRVTMTRGVGWWAHPNYNVIKLCIYYVLKQLHLQFCLRDPAPINDSNAASNDSDKASCDNDEGGGMVGAPELQCNQIMYLLCIEAITFGIFWSTFGLIPLPSTMAMPPATMVAKPRVTMTTRGGMGGAL